MKIALAVQEREEASIVDILNDMEQIRNEQLNGPVSNASKNSYLSSAAQLSSILESLGDSKLSGKIKSLLKARDKNPELLFYDYSQESFWVEAKKEFTKDLDGLLIGLTGDDFNGLNHKHHLWNAIKYFGTEEWEIKDKLRVYDTILAYNAPDSEEFKQSLLLELERKNVIVWNDALRVSNPKDLDMILALASRTDFNKLGAIMALDKKGRDGIKEKYKNASITDNFTYDNKSSIKAKTARFWRDLITWTTPISNWFISGFTDDVIGKLDRYLEKHGEHGLSYGSTGERYRYYTNLGAAFGGLIGGSMLGFGLFTGAFADPISWSGLYILVSSFQQSMVNLYKHDSWRYDYTLPHGSNSLHGLLLQIPFSFYEFAMKDTFENRKKDFLVSFQLKKPTFNNPKSITGKSHNYQPLLEELASLNLSQESEENLTWSIQNYHTQGEHFAAELLKKNKKSGWDRRHLAREHNALVLYDMQDYSQYKKISALVCFKDERYALTYISQNDKAADFDSISGLLSKAIHPKKKLEELSKLTVP